MILDAISFTASSAYILLIAACLGLGRGNPTLRRLTLTLRLYLLALAAQLINLFASIFDIRADGVLPVALSLFCLVTACVLVRYARKRRDAKADQVTAEAERTVSDWTAGAV